MTGAEPYNSRAGVIPIGSSNATTPPVLLMLFWKAFRAHGDRRGEVGVAYRRLPGSELPLRNSHLHVGHEHMCLARLAPVELASSGHLSSPSANYQDNRIFPV